MMNAGLRKSAIFTIILAAGLFGGVAQSFAQATDTDTEQVGLEVTWECPLLKTPEAGAQPLSVAGFAQPNLIRLQVLTPTPIPGPGSCPTEVPVASETTPPPGGVIPTVPESPEVAECRDISADLQSHSAAQQFVTDTAAIQQPGGCPTSNPPSRVILPTVPVVSQLPDTGATRDSDNTHTVFTLLASVGCLLVVAALKRQHRTGEY